jgi:glycosyltransferase involved in cell wall biosynthesis
VCERFTWAAAGWEKIKADRNKRTNNIFLIDYKYNYLFRKKQGKCAGLCLFPHSFKYAKLSIPVYGGSMRIGIDTFACNGGKSGVGVYLTQILRRIPPSGAYFELFGWDFDRYAYNEDAPNLEFIPQCFVNGKTANSLWHLFKYPEFAQQRSLDGCFFPAAHLRPPYKSPCPTVGVVHDLAAYWGTRRTREHLGAVLRVIFPNSLRRLDRIIAVSEWVKQELVELAHVKESHIEVVPNGIDHTAFYPRPRYEESVLLIQPFSFQRPYILCASRIDHPVKKISLL